VHQLHLVAPVVQQRRQAAADAHVDLHARVLRVLPVHVVALLVGDHLEGQLVVVAQEEAPLADPGDLRRAVEDLVHRRRLSRRTDMNMRGITGKWKHMWHSVALVAEVLDDVLGPLVGLREQHAVGYSASTVARTFLRKSCVSSRFSQFVPSRSKR
jgi:hypothetical protein